MNMQVLVAGEDLSFGKGGMGNSGFVKEKSREFDFKFYSCPKLHIDGEEVSATLVRRQVAEGDMESCQEFLGRPYHVSGTVCKGNQLGRTIGVPTCNIVAPADKLLPPNGVYFTDVYLGTGHFYGVTNVGNKPTVGNHYVVGIETHILGFDEEVYGEEMELDFLHFHRPERRFESLEVLKEQLHFDIAAAKEYFKI